MTADEAFIGACFTILLGLWVETSVLIWRREQHHRRLPR
jgi:hypothetical protein